MGNSSERFDLIAHRFGIRRRLCPDLESCIAGVTSVFAFIPHRESEIMNDEVRSPGAATPPPVADLARIQVVVTTPELR